MLLRYLHLAGLLLAVTSSATAQTTSSDWAWRPVVTQDSVSVTYVFYSEADNVNNGVVLKVANARSVDVIYEMTVIMRGPGREVQRSIRGRVPARSLVTGDEAGLFFVPFTDGTSIGEIGLRGYRFRSVH